MRRVCAPLALLDQTDVCIVWYNKCVVIVSLSVVIAVLRLGCALERARAQLGASIICQCSRYIALPVVALRLFTRVSIITRGINFALDDF